MYVIKATLKKYNWGWELDVFFSFWYTGVFHSSLCSSFTIEAKDSSTANMMKILQWLITSLKIKSSLLSKVQDDLAFFYLCFILSLSVPWVHHGLFQFTFSNLSVDFLCCHSITISILFVCLLMYCLSSPQNVSFMTNFISLVCYYIHRA